MALLLELAVGLGWLLEFVESSALELLTAFKICKRLNKKVNNNNLNFTKLSKATWGGVPIIAHQTCYLIKQYLNKSHIHT